ILSREESSILMYREGVADLQLHPDDVEEDYIASAKLLLISGTALCKSPSREAALKAVLLAHKTQTPVVLDMDFRAYTWQNADEVSVYLSLVAEKAQILLGSREEYDRTERLLGLDGTDAESSRYWLAQGAQIVIIKHGKQGSHAYTVQGQYGVKPFPVDALKGFGGGDGYASSFLHGYLAGWELIDALEFGSASAAMLVASHACSKDMPTEEAVRTFIREEKARYGQDIVRIEKGCE
ncbi:MAG: PfkB family carbohydrate kinase, partial [Clostridia bacterium]